MAAYRGAHIVANKAADICAISGTVVVYAIHRA
jgi:hypothetical protein